MFVRTAQLRFEEDGANSYEEVEQKDDSVRLYLSEEERFLNFADLTAEERHDVLAGLVFSQSKLKQSVSELQRMLEVAEENNTVLCAENMALCNQNQRMKQTIHDAEQHTDELEGMQSLLTEKEDLVGNLKTYTQKLEKEKVSLVDQITTMSSEMSSIVSARAIDKKNIVNFIQFQRSLQLQLEEVRVIMTQNDEAIRQKDFANEQLERSVREYTTIIQDLKERITNLESQQEEAIVNKVDYMTFDGAVIAGSQRAVSLEEELRLLPLRMGDPSDEEVQEQREEERVDMGHQVEVVKEEKNSLWTHMVKGVKAAGSFTLGFLVPLGVLASMLPINHEYHTRGSCMDTFWSAAGSIIEPYCTMTHMKPFPV
ncbi:centrosomal protein of 290 kDa isoform X2 [Esox lucius]|nr:centrosomal protein of 290 kDa isoform X2 [Esox lucius]